MPAILTITAIGGALFAALQNKSKMFADGKTAFAYHLHRVISGVMNCYGFATWLCAQSQQTHTNKMPCKKLQMMALVSL